MKGAWIGWSALAFLIGLMVFGAGGHFGEIRAGEEYAKLGPRVGMVAQKCVIMKRGDMVLYVDTYFPGGAVIRVLGTAVEVEVDTSMAAWFEEQKRGQ